MLGKSNSSTSKLRGEGVRNFLFSPKLFALHHASPARAHCHNSSLDRGNRYLFSEATSFDSSNVITSALDLCQDLPVYLSNTGPDSDRLREKWEMYLEASDLAFGGIGFHHSSVLYCSCRSPGWKFISNLTQNSACGLQDCHLEMQSSEISLSCRVEEH